MLPDRFTAQVFKGKSLGRILFNDAVRRNCANLHGSALDIAGNRSHSYYRVLPAALNVVVGNRDVGPGIDTRVDFNERLPFPDGQFDAVLFFNALYIVEDRLAFLCECLRILKPGGTLSIASPFITHEMPEPADWCRLTADGIAREATQAGFTVERIERLGDRCAAAMHLLHPILYFNVIRWIAYAKALAIDALLRRRLNAHPCPILYFAALRKP